MNTLISIVESVYLLYMFNYFKTSVYFNHPCDVLTQKHPWIDHSRKNQSYENKICPLGNLIGYLSPLWFLGRHSLDNNDFLLWNRRIILLVFIGSLLTNMNAFIYFLPIFILEKILNDI